MKIYQVIKDNFDDILATLVIGGVVAVGAWNLGFYSLNFSNKSGYSEKPASSVNVEPNELEKIVTEIPPTQSKSAHYNLSSFMLEDVESDGRITIPDSPFISRPMTGDENSNLIHPNGKK